MQPVGADDAALACQKSLIRRDAMQRARIATRCWRCCVILRRTVAGGNEEAALRIRHLAYFADYAQSIFIGCRRAAGEWLRRRIDHDNFREALRFALKECHCEQAISIAGPWFWYRQGLSTKGVAGWRKSAMLTNRQRRAWTPATNEDKRRRAIAATVPVRWRLSR